jgi:hypothetical protein
VRTRDNEETCLVGHLKRVSPYLVRWSERAQQAPDPASACRRSRARVRRAARLPPQTNGVGSAFHPRAVASNHAMICAGVWGCCPSKARHARMRWIDSALVSRLPASGVESTITPRAKSHSTGSGVWRSARLSFSARRPRTSVLGMNGALARRVLDCPHTAGPAEIDACGADSTTKNPTNA